MFTFDQLQAFVAVAQELHFGRAAERLNMTQPPLSRQIQSLERQLEAQLFDRSTRSVRLTAAGRAFLVEAQRILALAQTASDSARRAASGVSGSVHIGFTSVVGHAHLSAILRSAAERLPDVELVLHEMVTAAQLDGLAIGAIDLGLGRPSLGDPELSYRELPRERLVLAVPADSPLPGARGISMSDLDQLNFIMYNPEESRYFYDHLTWIFSVHGVKPTYVQRIAQVHTMMGLVEAGIGAALVPDSTRGWAPSGVRLIDIADLGNFPIASHLVWRRDSTNPALGSLLEVLGR
ncbi:LysR family transcriptional regulator [Salinibacterium sp. ZJ450]|uniref:LysR family transcriptional regulator n=1 Tax=Salinibacterium sp. ZJ450 TaxID=2708338 RepID=UPI001423E342|nr:LysR family transcriptional regulator [Salinibacterium sp. ZJ450]